MKPINNYNWLGYTIQLKNIDRFLCMFLLAIVPLSSCKKNSSSFDLKTSDTSVLYPTRIVYTPATNGVAVTVYTFTYTPSLMLFTLNNRRNAATTDTIYNVVKLDASGRQSQFGTTTNTTGFVIGYDPSGNVSTISQSYLNGTAKATDVRNFTYNNGQIVTSNKIVSGTATPLYTNTFVTDGNGNITSGSIFNFNFINNVNNNAVSALPNASSFTYYDSTLPNPFYGLTKNPELAFLPEQLWANVELILFSKNLLKEYITPNNPTLLYTYQFDNYNRITLVTITTETGPSVTQTYAITYAN